MRSAEKGRGYINFTGREVITFSKEVPAQYAISDVADIFMKPLNQTKNILFIRSRF